MIQLTSQALVEIQGDKVLHYVEMQKDYALYQVIGFSSPPIQIMDYRAESNAGLKKILEGEDVYTFPSVFNRPATVKIIEEEAQITVELSEAQGQPDHFLWVAVGMKDSIPVYDYKFRKLEFMDDNLFALFSLFGFSSEDPVAD